MKDAVISKLNIPQKCKNTQKIVSDKTVSTSNKTELCQGHRANFTSLGDGQI